MKKQLSNIAQFLLGVGIWLLISFVIFKCDISSGHNSYGRDPEDYSESSEENTDDDNSTSPESESPCGVEDGTHSATVEYYNPDTDYSATYTLEVDVEDCEVTTIYFPKGGWLDDSHISPTEIDNRHASIEDDQGRTFEIDIDD
jgi:hypothetical protein